MREGLVDLEEMQAVRGELPAEAGGQLQRKIFLPFPIAAHELLQCPAAEVAAQHAADRVRFHRLDDGVLVDGAEMFLHLLPARKLERLRHVQAGVFGRKTLLLDPLFDDFLVLHDFDARLEGVERHPGEPLGVQFAELVLVIVVVRRPENLAAHAALRHKSVFALGRFGGRAFGLVKRGKMNLEHVRDRLVLAQPRRVIERAGEQRLYDRAIGVFLHPELDGVTLRLRQNNLRNLEQRIRAAGHLDLARERFDAVFVRQKRDGDFRQWRGWFEVPPCGTFAPVIALGKSFLAVAELSTTGTRRTGTAALAERVRARSTAPAFARAVFASGGFAGELRVRVDGRFSLRPSGQEKLFQINFDVRNTTHIKSMPRHAGPKINHRMDWRGLESKRSFG